jgi:altronate dehydratase
LAPLYIRVHAADNTGIIVNPEGAVSGTRDASGFAVRERIPQSHKVALCNIESGTQQLASMNLHVFTTGEGSPYGLALVPVIKVSSRSALAERWHDLIDIDAGRIATGEATIEQVGWELFQLLLDVASGRKRTWADHWGLSNALTPFNPGPVT